MSDTTLSRDDLEHTISELEAERDALAAELAEAKRQLAMYVEDYNNDPDVAPLREVLEYIASDARADGWKMEPYWWRVVARDALSARTREALARGPYSGEGVERGAVQPPARRSNEVRTQLRSSNTDGLCDFCGKPAFLHVGGDYYCPTSPASEGQS